MSDMAGAYDRAAALAARVGFCEAPGESLPVDIAATAERPGGPLSGWLVGLKSNFRVSGQAWTAGIGARRDRIADRDAEITARLRDAGAGLLSRLLMDEGALGAASDNPHFGRCDNPAMPGHSPGGSSGGSAAAVACGAVQAALGSDTMGSVRIPAAYCGVFGLKMTPGLCGGDGLFPLASSLDAPGILGRNAPALETVFGVLAPAAPVGADPARLLVASDAALAGCTPATLAFLGQARTVLADALAAPVAAPDFDYPGLRADTFLTTEAEAVTTLGEEAGLSAGLNRLIDYGRRIPADRLDAARGRMEAAARALLAALGDDGVLLLPTVAASAFAHDTPPPAGQADYTALANLAGCPAIAVPKPETGPGPRVSVQIVGSPGSDRALIRLAGLLAQRL